MDAFHQTLCTESTDCGLTTEGPRRLDRDRIPSWNLPVRRVLVYPLFLLQLDPGAQSRALAGLVQSTGTSPQDTSPRQGREGRVTPAFAD